MPPASPGSLIDNSARVVAGVLSEKIGKPVVVDNKPGASGIVDTEGTRETKGVSAAFSELVNLHFPQVDTRPRRLPVLDFVPLLDHFGSGVQDVRRNRQAVLGRSLEIDDQRTVGSSIGKSAGLVTRTMRSISRRRIASGRDRRRVGEEPQACLLKRAGTEWDPVDAWTRVNRSKFGGPGVALAKSSFSEPRRSAQAAVG